MKFFTPKEIAEYCGVNKVTPIKWINDGDLPAVKEEKPRANNSKSRVLFYYYVSEDDLRVFSRKVPEIQACNRHYLAKYYDQGV